MKKNYQCNRPNAIKCFKESIYEKLHILNEIVLYFVNVQTCTNIVMEYTDTIILDDENIRLVIHEYLSVKCNPKHGGYGQNKGGFEIIPGNFVFSYLLKDNFLNISPKSDGEYLFNVYEWLWAYISPACHCGMYGHPLELQWFHNNQWYHLWNVTTDTAYWYIPIDDIEWDEDGQGSHCEFLMQKTLGDDTLYKEEKTDDIKVIQMRVELNEKSKWLTRYRPMHSCHKPSTEDEEMVDWYTRYSKKYLFHYHKDILHY